MKILVYSDSHGRSARFESALEMHPDASYVLFLGDGLRDYATVRDRHEKRMFAAVSGNCDFMAGNTPDELLLDIGGVKFLLMHGHKHGVKYGIMPAAAYAASKGADVLLYGHTHIKDNRYLTETSKPIYVFNPGSIGQPAEGEPSYGIIEILSNGILLSHGKI